jgi:hypothetical protein
MEGWKRANVWKWRRKEVAWQKGKKKKDTRV